MIMITMPATTLAYVELQAIKICDCTRIIEWPSVHESSMLIHELHCIALLGKIYITRMWHQQCKICSIEGYYNSKVGLY